MNRVEVKAKLTALKGPVLSLMAGASGTVRFDELSSLFNRYARLRDLLRSEHADLFDDLPVRPEPEPESIPLGDGAAYTRPFASAQYALDLHTDIDFCVTLLEGLPDEPDDATPTVTREGFFIKGQYFDAQAAFQSAIDPATKSIVIVDNYIGRAVLDLISKKKAGVVARIMTLNLDAATRANARAFVKQYGDLEIRASNAFHDRFLVVDDDQFYHFGASIKDIGHRGCMFSRIEEPIVTKQLRAEIAARWAGATVLVS